MEILNGSVEVKTRLGGKRIFSTNSNEKIDDNIEHLVELIRNHNSIQVFCNFGYRIWRIWGIQKLKREFANYLLVLNGMKEKNKKKIPFFPQFSSIFQERISIYLFSFPFYLPFLQNAGTFEHNSSS